jgi:hypothetical protein
VVILSSKYSVSLARADCKTRKTSNSIYWASLGQRGNHCATTVISARPGRIITKEKNKYYFNSRARVMRFVVEHHRFVSYRRRARPLSEFRNRIV